VICFRQKKIHFERQIFFKEYYVINSLVFWKFLAKNWKLYYKKSPQLKDPGMPNFWPTNLGSSSGLSKKATWWKCLDLHICGCKFSKLTDQGSMFFLYSQLTLEISVQFISKSFIHNHPLWMNFFPGGMWVSWIHIKDCFIRDIFIPFNLLFDFLGSLGIF